MAFGGGKGGVGRSTLCTEVARSLARRDERILCVDASWNCPTLHTLMSVEEPHFNLDDPSVHPLGEEGSHIADFIQATGEENVWLASVAAGRSFPYLRPDLSPVGLIQQLHALDFDWVFLDLSPGLDPFDAGLFALSDIPILVATPEPGAVRMATQLLRHALFQAVRYHPEAFEARQEIQELLYRQDLRLSVDSLLERAPTSKAATIVEESTERLEPYVVVNFVREGAEQDLGHVICHAWHQSVGIFPRLLTSVDYENRRWFYHRRSAGTNSVRGEEALSRDIESLAQQALDISVVDTKFPRPIPTGDDVHPALRLGISPDSSRNEVRQHCRRLWEGYKRERAVDVIFRNTERRTEIAEELETLYRRVLTLPSDTFDTVGEASKPSVGHEEGSSTPRETAPEVDRRESGRETMPGPPGGAEKQAAGSDEDASDDPPDDPAEEAPPEVGETEPAMGGPSLALETYETMEPGEIVETLRRREEISLQELSRRTHIGIKYLTAIEDGNIGALPRPVYLRGYLREIARAFDVNPDALVREYVRLLDEAV
jgi:flagellar biosynthesis protein FlhG